MVDHEAVVKRIHNGGTRSVKALKRQLGYLSRQTNPERETIRLVSSAQLMFENDDGIENPNNIEQFAELLFTRSGRLPADDAEAELPHDQTIHFVLSFPQGTDIEDAERAGHDWAISVFGHGYRNSRGFVQRHKFVAAYHRAYEHGDNPNPHMHVVVDRSPRGGGNLLTLKRGHPHWSYEAMRVQAVEAAANHGIELVATTRVDRGLQERPMTDVQMHRLKRLLIGRPTTLDEYERRKADAATVPYEDDEFDDYGFAPANADRAFTPLDDDNDDDSRAGGDDRSASSESSGGRDHNRRSPRSMAPLLDSRHNDHDEDDDWPSGTAGTRLTAGNLQLFREQLLTERDRAADAQQGAQDNEAADTGEGASEDNEIKKRRKKARKDRRRALRALHTHRANTENIAEDSIVAWREEDRHLLRKARLALIEQRRAFAGETNVTTRAQAAAAIRNGQRPENDHHAANRGTGPDERRRGRQLPGADPDHSR